MNLDNRQVNGPAFNTALFDIKSADASTITCAPSRPPSPTCAPTASTSGIRPFQALHAHEKASVQIRMEAYNVLNTRYSQLPAPPRATALSAPLPLPPTVPHHPLGPFGLVTAWRAHMQFFRARPAVHARVRASGTQKRRTRPRQ